MAGRFSFGLCNDGPEIVSLNDGYPNLNGAALLERALSGTNFGNGNNTMATLNGGGQNGGQNYILNLPNHSIGISDGNQISFTNGGHHLTNGGHHLTNAGVDSGGGNSCNNMGVTQVGQNNFGSGVFTTNGGGLINIGGGNGGNVQAYQTADGQITLANLGMNGAQFTTNVGDQGNQMAMYASNVDLCGQGYQQQGNVQADFSNFNQGIMISGGGGQTAADYGGVAQGSQNFCSPMIATSNGGGQTFSPNAGICFGNGMMTGQQCGGMGGFSKQASFGPMNGGGLCRTGSFGSAGMAPIVPIAIQQQMQPMQSMQSLHPMQAMQPQQPCCKCCPQFVMQKQIVNRVPMPIRVPTPSVPRVLFTRKRCCCRRTYVL